MHFTPGWLPAAHDFSSPQSLSAPLLQSRPHLRKCLICAKSNTSAGASVCIQQKIWMSGGLRRRSIKCRPTGEDNSQKLASASVRERLEKSGRIFWGEISRQEPLLSSIGLRARPVPFRRLAAESPLPSSIARLNVRGNISFHSTADRRNSAPRSTRRKVNPAYNFRGGPRTSFVRSLTTLQPMLPRVDI